jgi:hypothetical protein
MNYFGGCTKRKEEVTVKQIVNDWRAVIPPTISIQKE